jgi:hypothetical protein
MSTDSPGFRAVRRHFPKFAADWRNIMLGMCGDGVTPFDKGNKGCSLYFMVMQIYNLPADVRTIYDHLQMYGILDGSHACIQLAWRIFTDDMKEMWRVGSPTYDVAADEVFDLRAMVLNFVHDYPGASEINLQRKQGAKQGCTKCNIDGFKCNIINTMIYARALQTYPDEQPSLRTKAQLNADLVALQVRLRTPPHIPSLSLNCNTIVTCLHTICIAYGYPTRLVSLRDLRDLPSLSLICYCIVTFFHCVCIVNEL